MAKPLVFELGGKQIAVSLTKVDRSSLYGYVETEALDDRGRPCTLATLADDGQTLIGPGGTALASLTAEGNWVDRRKLAPVDAEGRRLTPVPSSFAAPLPLEKTASIDEYLSHNVRAVYQLSGDEIAPLLTELKKGTIYTFPYSFRGGIEPDVGFLLMAADGNAFLAVASPTKIEFVGLQQAALATEEEPAEEEEEELDFGMI